jgi:hypothetical protein
VTTTPTVPPQPWAKIVKQQDGSSAIEFSRPFMQWITALWQNAGATNNAITGNVNSGVALAQAAALAAQATADGAAQQAADVGAAALAFSASASPANVSGFRLGSGAVTTNATTVTPTGGTGPYTYAWSLVSGDTFTVNSPTAATTTFTTGLTTGQDKSAVYRCTVTDSLLAEATATVGVSVTENS